MASGFGDGGAVGAINGRDFTEELAILLVDDHEAVLAGNEDPVVGGIGDNVIPGAIAADSEGARDVVGGRLGEKHAYGGQGDEEDAARGHGASSAIVPAAGTRWNRGWARVI